MLERLIESTRLDPMVVLHSIARITASYSDVPYAGRSAMLLLIDKALRQIRIGHDAEALAALAAVMIQQAYVRRDVALAEEGIAIWARQTGFEPDIETVISAIVEAAALHLEPHM